MPVGEMLRRMPSSEISEWMAFYDLRARPPKPKQSNDEIRTVLNAMVKKGSGNG
jgi:hypothetical protein